MVNSSVRLNLPSQDDCFSNLNSQILIVKYLPAIRVWFNIDILMTVMTNK